MISVALERGPKLIVASHPQHHDDARGSWARILGQRDRLLASFGAALCALFAPVHSSIHAE